MSVQLLSSIDPTPEAEKVEKYNSTSSEAAEADKRLDALVAKAVEKIPSAQEDEKPAPRKGLDALIGEGLDNHYAEIEKREAFDRSRGSRDTLNKAYKQFNANTAKTLDQFLAFHDELKRDPQGAGARLAESYLHAGPFGVNGTETETPKAEAWFDHTGKRHNGRVLESIVDSAMEGGDRQEFEATQAQRKKLDEAFPGLPFDEQMKRLVEIDTRLRQDPLAAAAQIAATYGMPVLPHSVAAHEQHHAERQAADMAVQRAGQILPNFEQLRLPMAHIIESGQANNLQEAYQIAAQQHQGHVWTAQQLNEVAKIDPALARSIADTLLHDKTFAHHNGHVADPGTRLHSAWLWVKAKAEQATQRSVSKARKATPVKSSSGAIPTGASKGSGIDSAIANAMHGWRG